MGRPRKSGSELPPRVYLKRGTYFYETPGTRKWVRLGCALEEALQAHRVLLLAATAGPPLSKKNALSDHVKWGALANSLYAKAKGGAKSRGLAFEIDISHVVDLLVKADGKCALTGIPFEQTVVGKSRKRPWSASLDRIESTLGYCDGNIRVVCLSVNIALWDFGDDVLRRIASTLPDTQGLPEKRDLESKTCGLDQAA